MRRAACAMALVTTLCGCGSSPQLPNDTIEIKTLTIAQVEALAQHEGGLFLFGLNSISDEAAKALGANSDIFLPPKFRFLR